MVHLLLTLAVATQPARTFDLRRNFFVSDAAEAADRERVRGEFERLAKLAIGATRSAANLVRTLDVWSDAERGYRRHDLYFFARSATNSAEHYEGDMEPLRSARRQATRAVRRAICAAPAGRIDTLRRSAGKYDHFIAATRDACGHRPAAVVQAAIDAYAFAADPSFYFETVETTDFGTVDVGGKKLDAFKDQGALLANPSPQVREETERKLWEGYARHEDLFAYGLAQIVKACDVEAHLESYAGCSAKALAAEELAPQQVQPWYDQIARSYRPLPPSGDESLQVRFTFDEAAGIIEQALAPLGPDYQNELRALLDPGTGRVDVGGSGPRLPMQGTASVDSIGTSIFYAFQFEGTYLDVMLLAHEAGHAVQAMMMSRAGVPALNGRGAAWMTESFGRFNELVVADFLQRTADAPERKALFRRRLLDRGRVLFGAATEGAVELALHARIARGHASARDLSEVTRQEGSRFSDRFSRPADARLWTRVESYYADPLHATSSMVSSLLGLVLFGRYRASPQAFLDGYVRLLSHGYDDSSAALLKRFVGVDLDSDDLVPEAIDALEGLAH